MSIVHETLSYLLTNLKTYEQILAVSYMQNKYAIYFWNKIYTMTFKIKWVYDENNRRAELTAVEMLNFENAIVNWYITRDDKEANIILLELILANIEIKTA